ncbi:MAG: leucine-rich repeat domain-containing protein [Desulfobacteraceae bacterium]|nr:leucine-rich repeat domain-containing protein [Desulfobacteraceae bacterium]
MMRYLSPVAGLTNLTVLDFWSNRISDISALAGLTNLTELNLFDNQVSDLKPLVDNSGIDSGDSVLLHHPSGGNPNPLSTTSCTVYIPQLYDRGVFVSYICWTEVYLYPTFAGQMCICILHLRDRDVSTQA